MGDRLQLEHQRGMRLHAEYSTGRDLSKLAQDIIKKGFACLTASTLIANSMAGVALADLGEQASPGQEITQVESEGLAAAKFNLGTASEDEIRDLSECAISYVRRSISVGTQASLEAFGVSLTYFDESGKAIRLALGTDYAVGGWYEYDNDADEGEKLDTAPSQVGEYYVELVGIGDYTGVNRFGFDIVGTHSLSWASAYASNVLLGTVPTAESLKLRVYDYGYDYDYDYDSGSERVQLVYGKDYEIGGWYAFDYDTGITARLDAAPVETGEYRVELVGIGDYTGTKLASFEIIDPHDLARASAYADNVLLGTVPSAESLNLRVYEYQEGYTYDYDSDSERVQLTYGKDYEIGGWYAYDSDYEEYRKLDATPVEAGRKYRVELVGIGDYTGTKWLRFAIVDPHDLSWAKAYAEDVAFGTVPTYESLNLRVCKYQADDSSDPVELAYGKDYAISGWYEGDYDYDTGFQKLDAAPTEAGEYYVELVGIGDYTGTNRVGFEIVGPRDLSEVSVYINNVALGTVPTAESLNLRVYDYDYDYDDAELAYGKDYVIGGWFAYDYDAGTTIKLNAVPTEAGEYSVELVGIGDYTGTKRVGFEIIDPHDLSWASAYAGNVLLGTVPTAESLSPRVYEYRIDYDSERVRLTYGKDYVIGSWYAYDYSIEGYKKLDAAPTEVGVYQVGLVGTGKYDGTTWARFEIIDPHDLSRSSVYADDVLLGTVPTAESLSLRMYEYQIDYDADPVELAYGKDYAIGGWYAYDYDAGTTTRLDAAPTEAGEYYVELVGNGDYTGSKRVGFEIVDPHDLSRSSVYADNVLLGTVPTAESLSLRMYEYQIDYDSNPVELTYGKDFAIGGWYNCDYDYDAGGFGKLDAAPTEAGEYFVELVGIGDYAGTKRVFFDIVDPHDLSRARAYASNVALGTVPTVESLSLRVYEYQEGYDYDSDAVELAYGKDFTIGDWYAYDYDAGTTRLDAAPTEAGEYRLELVGIGDYTGTKRVSFEILQQDGPGEGTGGGEVEDGTIASGTWGTCPWEISSDGVLTVLPGEGVTVYEEGEPVSPWDDYAGVIDKVVFKQENRRKVVLPANSSSLLSLSKWELNSGIRSVKSPSEMDLSGCDTSKVTDMSNMFFDCRSITSLDLSSWDTSKVASMSDMFRSCDHLTSLNLSGWNTSNVTSMSYMLYNCAFKTLDLSGWDTSKVVALDFTFGANGSLSTLDLSGWDTSNVTNMSCLFQDCGSLKTVYVDDAWSTAALEHENTSMFIYCRSLVGGNGTVYDENHVGAAYARIDTAGAPGYFTAKVPTPSQPAKTSISEAVVAAIADQAYTGSAITPAVSVTLGGKTLASGTDYTVAYSNNVNVGTATVTVTGVGSYEGTKIATFSIVAATQPEQPGQTQPGDSQPGSDQPARQDISGATVAAIPDQTYTGSAITPAVTVTLGGKVLSAETDYTLTYAANAAVGTASVVVVGTGGYLGTKVATFNIVAAEGTGGDGANPGDGSQGGGVQPGDGSSQGSGTQPGGDSSGGNNGDSGNGNSGSSAGSSGNDSSSANGGGSATPGSGANGGSSTTPGGGGNGGGSTTSGGSSAMPTPAKTSIAAAKVKLSSASYIYDGKAKQPSATVTLGGKRLTAGADYKVEYSGNVGAGTARATVTGMGAYEGTATATFNITKAANPMKVSTTKKAVLRTYLKRGPAYAYPISVSGTVTKVTLAKESGSKKLSLDKRVRGRVVVKKGTKKGTYKMTMKVRAAGNANYEAASKTVKVIVKVK